MGKACRMMVVVTVVHVLLVPTAASAQTGSSAIAGVVRDTTGGVLPGVTVEAASPALIEKVRTAVTDGQGQYRIVDLRPGVYSLTFMLPGFGTIRRDGVNLVANFTAPVNIEMSIGDVQETVVVTAESPVVDVQRVVQQTVTTREVLDALPTSRNVNSIAQVVPAVAAARDVGGTQSEQGQVSVHGGLGMQFEMNGMSILNGLSNLSVFPNDAMIQEISFGLSGLSADSEGGGVRVNLIPKEGGNQFSGVFFTNTARQGMQSENLTDEIRSRGLTQAPRIWKLWDLNGAFGGPLRRDKLWFYSGARYWGNYTEIPGLYYNATPASVVYTPDIGRGLALFHNFQTNQSLRLTSQVTQKDKIQVGYERYDPCWCTWYLFSPFISMEALPYVRSDPNGLIQAIWTHPATNRLLFEVGTTVIITTGRFEPPPDYPSAGELSSITELSTGFTYRATVFGYQTYIARQSNTHASASYITGSHSTKVGIQYQYQSFDPGLKQNNDTNLQFLRGVPVSVTQWATPLEAHLRRNSVGVYAQDDWTIKRASLNLGLRLDHLNNHIPVQDIGQRQFVGPLHIDKISNVPNWTDLSPRIGAAFDLFGNAKTAVKAHIGRFVIPIGAHWSNAINPLSSTVYSTQRSWTDTNGDFSPQENELGPPADPGFGTLRQTTTLDDAVREGFNTRPANWEISAGVQHELLPGLAVNAAYFRRWYINHGTLDDLGRSPSDYDPYCITAPVDPRLGSASGRELCGFYDISEAKFSQLPQNVIKLASDFGKIDDYWHGFDVTLNGRLPRGIVMGGGLSTGRAVFDNCDVIGKVDQTASGNVGSFLNGSINAGESLSRGGSTGAPQRVVPVGLPSPSAVFCHQDLPWQAQIKFNGTIPLPRGFQVAATIQNLPGPMITADYVATSAEIAPSLGRPLAGNTRTVILPLIAPGTVYEDRNTQVDFRFSWIFSLRGRARVKANLDAYNLFNSGAILSVNSRYGPAWLRPTSILPGRLLKVGAQVDF